MALPEIEALCRKCHQMFRAQPKRTFLGFQRFVCPHCSREVIYPLTSGYRIAYWVFVVFMALVLLASWASGQIAFPGLIGLAIIWALDKDRRLRKDVANANVAAGAPQTH
jgi:hypothetical protein